MQIDIEIFKLYLDQVKEFSLSGIGPDSVRNIKLSHSEGIFSLTSTNLITSMILTLDNTAIQNQDNFEVLLDYLKLKPFLAHLNSNNVTIDAKSKANKVVLKSGRRKATVSTYDITQYPLIKTKLDSTIFDIEVETDVFLEAISRTAFVGASGNGSHITQGVFLDMRGMIATFVSTDGNSMSAYDMSLQSSQRNAVLLPAKEILKVATALRKVCYDDNIRLISDGNTFIIQMSNGMISIITSGQKFIRYQAKISEDLSAFPVRAQVSVREMSHALSYLHTSNTTVNLFINASTGEIELSNNEFNTGDESLDIVNSISHDVEDDFRITLSSTYLSIFFKALLKAKTDTATIYMDDYNLPIYIIDNSNESSTILLAPSEPNW